MKKLLLPFVFLTTLAAHAQKTDSTFSISGKFEKVKTGKIFLTIYGENVAVKDSTTIDLSMIQGCWINSREESSQFSIYIFRPCDYKSFPLSRFRDRIQFEPDGECSYLYLAPNDAHHMVTGKWIYDKLKQNIEITDTYGHIAYKFKVISISKDMLKVEEQR